MRKTACLFHRPARDRSSRILIAGRQAPPFCDGDRHARNPSNDLRWHRRSKRHRHLGLSSRRNRRALPNCHSQSSRTGSPPRTLIEKILQGASCPIQVWSRYRAEIRCNRVGRPLPRPALPLRASRATSFLRSRTAISIKSDDVWSRDSPVLLIFAFN